MTKNYFPIHHPTYLLLNHNGGLYLPFTQNLWPVIQHSSIIRNWIIKSTKLPKIFLSKKNGYQKLHTQIQWVPLADETDAFIKACTQYDLDCYLLPAISGIESSFGLYLRPGTFNPFGWGRGDISFTSYSDAIMTVGKGLERKLYQQRCNNGRADRAHILWR